MNRLYNKDGQTIDEHPLFRRYTYKDHPHHPDGTVDVPRISSFISDQFGEFDLSNMESGDKATFLYGLSRLLTTMMEIGEVEHTNDWDWAIGFWTDDGFIGDYQLIDYEDEQQEDLAAEEGPFVDSFKFSVDHREFAQMGSDQKKRDDYYNNLEVIIESWGEYAGEAHTMKPDQAIKVGSIQRVIITER